MGCEATQPARVKAQQPGSNYNRECENSGQQQISPPKKEKTLSDILEEDFQSLLQGTTKIPKEQETYPLVVFGKSSIPIIKARLCLEEGDQTHVQFPVATATRYGNGRIVAVGSIDMMTNFQEEYAIFIENTFQWVAGNAHGDLRILLVDFPNNLRSKFLNFFNSVGFHALSTSRIEGITHCNVAICLSSSPHGEKIIDLARRGGGVIILADSEVSDEQFLINRYIAPIGIAYASCPLIVGPKTADHISVNFSFLSVMKSHFSSLAQRYITLLQDENPDIKEIDSFVTPLRYIISQFPRIEDPDFVQSDLCNLVLLQQVLDASINFLEQTNAFEDDQICPALKQSIIIILSADIMSKLPTSVLVNYNFSKTFPGEISSDVQLSDISLKINKLETGWYSTGLYLPPATQSVVSVTGDFDDLIIQIGAHITDISSKQGPWNRWPDVTITYEAIEQEFLIISPFGGPIYLINQNDEKVFTNISVSFKNVCKIPFYNQPSETTNTIIKGWGNTINYPGLFAEIQFKHVIFTIPKSYIPQLKSLLEVETMINKMIDTVFRFLGDLNNTSLNRVVFDVDLPDEGLIGGYPIVFPTEYVVPLLSEPKPTGELFTLLVYIASLSIPEGFFDEDHEKIISTVAACTAFLRIWPKENPVTFINFNLPENFSAMWDVYKEVPVKVFPRAMYELRKNPHGSLDNEDDRWVEFIQMIQSISKKDIFSQLIQPSQNYKTQILHIPNFSSSSLQSFQLESQDDES